MNSAAEFYHPSAKGGTVAAISQAAAEAREVLAIQRRRVDIADGYVHRSGSLARLCLVHHRTYGSRLPPDQLDSR